jgi:predicted nucleic acid-binding protein
MGVKIIGTLGILRLAKDRGMLKQVKPLLDELRKVGAYISDSLYTRMLKDVREI